MQKTLREKGKGFMDDATHESFVKAFHSGDLVKPEQVGPVMARLVVKPDLKLSGKFLKYDCPLLARSSNRSEYGALTDGIGGTMPRWRPIKDNICH